MYKEVLLIPVACQYNVKSDRFLDGDFSDADIDAVMNKINEIRPLSDLLDVEVGDGVLSVYTDCEEMCEIGISSYDRGFRLVRGDIISLDKEEAKLLNEQDTEGLKDFMTGDRFEVSRVEVRDDEKDICYTLDTFIIKEEKIDISEDDINWISN